MRKITILLSVIVLSVSSLFAQTTLEVGAGKTYATIVDAWNVAKTDPATDIIINVAEGTYVEASTLTALSGKKITIVGAGADKTIVKRSASTTFALPGTAGWATSNANRLFQLNANSDNLNLTLEKLSLETIGYNNANGGGVINATGLNQQFTFRNCNFKNVIARVGAIIQVQGSDSLMQLKFENCFIEECGAFNNNAFNGLITIQSGQCEIKNTTFMNNSFNAINIGGNETKPKDTDSDPQAGAIVSAIGKTRSLVVENCYLVNNKFILGDLDKTHPMIAVKSKIGPDSISILIKNVISVQNKRSNSVDCDLYYQNTVSPVVENAIFNAVRKFDRVQVDELTERLDDSDVESMEGTVIIDGTKIYTSPEVNFEMDATTNLPKIFVDATTGVKYLNRISTGLADNRMNNLRFKTDNGFLSISSDKIENITIYNVLGAQVARFNQVNNAEIALTSGAYIVKTASSSVKVLVK